MLIDLKKRSNQPELMDDFKEGLQALRVVFDDINRVNVILGGNNITINAVARLIKENPQESYTIVDMGCGDGNMLREVANFCRKNTQNTRLIGIDLNQEALQLASEASVDYSEIEYQHKDILQIKSTDLNCDIVINTLCMHHFVDKDLLTFLAKFNELASIGVVFNDLQSSRWAYYLFKLFSLIFIKTKTAKIDGLISISKGFIKSDLLTYTKNLPSVAHQIKWKWAFRYVWVMQPKLIKKSI
jgi:ubiquinone/menaquinone biosynthesis C-methylase UbiE